MKKIAKKHNASRSLVSAALWGRAFGPKARHIHETIDQLMSGLPLE